MESNLVEPGLRRVDLLDLPKRRRVNVDPARLAALREERAKEAGEEAPARGPFDSGRGVRIQVVAVDRCHLEGQAFLWGLSLDGGMWRVKGEVGLLHAGKAVQEPCSEHCSIFKWSSSMFCCRLLVLQGGRVYDSLYGVTCHW